MKVMFKESRGLVILIPSVGFSDWIACFFPK